MSTFKGTPGPWEASDDVILCGDPDMAIGTAFPCDRDESKYGTGFKYGEISKANASLIAAAPELLEALRDVIGWIPDAGPWFTEEPRKSVERARAALRKATGEQA